jgi:hypothetical protein
MVTCYNCVQSRHRLMAIILSGSSDTCLEIAKRIGLEGVDRISGFSIHFDADSAVYVKVAYYPGKEQVEALADFVAERKFFVSEALAEQKAK